jgi:anti-sigma regulatory factor (Ser/Thr protein kinase)
VTPTRFHLKAPARLDQVRLLVLAVRAVCAEALGESPALDDVELALAELLNNAVEHGVALDPAAVELEVALTATPGWAEIEVLDAFEPFVLAEGAPALPGELAEGGYGRFLVYELMDEVRYERRGDRNAVVTRKRWTVAE